MFIIFATKKLNDGTKGFRFNVLGRKGLYRKRTSKTRRGISSGSTMSENYNTLQDRRNTNG